MPDRVLPYHCLDSTTGECLASRHCKPPTAEAVLFALAATSFGKYHQGFLQDVPDLICSILTSDEATCEFHPTAVSLGNHVSGQALFCKRASHMESPNNCKHSVGENPQPFVAEVLMGETCWRSPLSGYPSQGPGAFPDSCLIGDFKPIVPSECSFPASPLQPVRHGILFSFAFQLWQVISLF